MNIAKLSAVLVAGVISVVASHAPAFAASPMTNVFLNNLVPNIDFLDRSSRMALTNTKNARLREFAFAQAKEQTIAANSVDAWIAADKRPIVEAAADAGPLQTGRSVAIDGPAGQRVAPDMRLPMGQEDLDSIEGLNGSDFDTSYKAKQLDALNQVKTDYEMYIAKGDDPVLLAIASRELPKVKARIAALNRL